MRVAIAIPNQSLVLGSMLCDEMAVLESGLRAVMRYTNPPLTEFEKVAIRSLADGLAEVRASGLYEPVKE